MKRRMIVCITLAAILLVVGGGILGFLSSATSYRQHH